MSRPDLPKGFGGWQALDATPQERSPRPHGPYRLGPCPVYAVKLGQRMNYDVEFVISEVSVIPSSGDCFRNKAAIIVLLIKVVC